MDRRNPRHHYMMKENYGRKYIRKLAVRETNFTQLSDGRTRTDMEIDSDSTVGMPEETAAENSSGESVRKPVVQKTNSTQLSSGSTQTDMDIDSYSTAGMSADTAAEYSSGESDFDGFENVDANHDEKLGFLNRLILAESQKHPLPTETSIISALLHLPEGNIEVSSTQAGNHLVDQSTKANLNENNDSTDHLSENSSDDSPGHNFGEDTFDSFNKPMQFNTAILMSDVLFMILNFYIKYKLTQEAVVQLLKMINLITGVKNCPESFEAFAAVFPDPYYSYRVYFCTECQCEYGCTTPTKHAVCSIPGCNSTKFDFFIVLPIENQLKETVLKYRTEMQDYNELIEADNISDISQGSIFAKTKEKDDGKYITLSVNTDGAAAYRWTLNKPCYPIFIAINNLPPRLRFNKHNIILGAIWLSKGDPNMCLFFKHFCKEVQNLRNGLEIGEEKFKVVVLQTCLDTVARCKVQGTTQFNGKYGCSVCLHSGKVVNGNQIRYPVLHAEQRDHKTTRNLMLEVHETKIPKLGIKNISVFLEVPDFDIIYGFPPDYMHNVLLGVVKLMWELFTASTNHHKPFYVGLQLKEVEQRMLSIRPPSNFSRYPGKLDEMKKNKAADWENMLFHYFYPCFFEILSNSFLDHVMLLSSSIFELLDVHLTLEQIDTCEQSLNIFVKKFEEFYGVENMVFNIHLLTHLPESTRNFGALWNSSLFPYENANGVILQYRTGNNHPVIQISTKYMLNRICHYKTTSNSEIMMWHSRIWSIKKMADLQYDHRLLYILPENVCIDVDVHEREFSYHDRILIANIQFRTNKSCKKLGYDDSYVYINGEFFRIEQILTANNNATFILATKLNTTKLFKNMFSYLVTDTLVLKRTNNYFRQCVNVSVECNENVINFISICKYRSQVD